MPILALSIFAVAMIGRMGTSFIPEVDYGQLTVNISQLEENPLSQEEMQAYTDTLTEQILAIEGIDMVGAFEGSSLSIGGMGGASSSDADYEISMYVLCDSDSRLSGKQAAARISELLLTCLCRLP